MTPPNDHAGVARQGWAKLPHYRGLDGLRGLAVIVVALSHINWISDPVHWPDTAWRTVTQAGWYGVDLFFALSGFLITLILLHEKGSAGYFRNFYARRIVRIFPLYYIVLVALLWVLPHVKHEAAILSPQQSQAWYWLFVSNIGMATGRLSTVNSLAVTWSLAIEEQFYLVWPLLVAIYRKRTLALICLAIVLSGFACRLIGLLAGKPPVWGYMLTPCRLDGLAVGALAAIASRNDLVYRRMRRVAPSILAAGSVITLAAFAIDRSVQPLSFYCLVLGTTALSAIGAALIVLLTVPPESGTASRIADRIFNLRFLRTFGKFSYAIYLLHVPVFGLVHRPIQNVLERLPMPFGLQIFRQWLFDISLITITLLLAIASWYLLEVHCLKLKRYFIYARPLETGRDVPLLPAGTA